MLRICVPATTANLGPGFDCLGMALALYNYLEVIEDDSDCLRLEVRGEGEKTLARNDENLIPRVMADFFTRVGHVSGGLRLVLENNIPIGKGLGSSAAAVAGALVAANHLAGSPLTRGQLLELGAAWEGHPDNVAAALYGGVVVTARAQERIICRRFDPPPRLRVVVAVPNFALPTSASRRVLPAAVPVEDAVFNVGRTGLLVLALLQNDLELLAVATEDRLHQPYRAPMIPGLLQVFQAARQAGALGVTLSGAGPAVVAFVTGEEDSVGEAMCRAFRAHGVACRTQVLAPSREGAFLVGADGGQ